MNTKKLLIVISLFACPLLSGMENKQKTSKAKKVEFTVKKEKEEQTPTPAQQHPAKSLVNSFDDPKNPFYQANQLFSKSAYIDATIAYNDVFRGIASYQVNADDDQIANARTCYGQACWALGNYEKGSKEFEERLKHSSKTKLKNKLPYGIATDELKGLTILVRANEPGTGLGDTFTFSGLLQKFREVGATIILVTQNPLKGVMSRSTECADVVLSANEAKALEDKNELDFDYDMYVMSGMFYISKNGIVPVKVVQDIPHFKGYIHPLEKLTNHYFEMLGQDLKGRKPLGIWWAASSNPVPGGRILQRDVPLKTLALLAGIKSGAKFVSLQGDKRYPITQDEFDKLTADDQKKRQGDIVAADVKALIMCADIEIKDFDKVPFDDTLAMMAAIDKHKGYLVGPDTSTPNLGGAAGYRTIMLLGKNADTRWGESAPGAKAKPCVLWPTVIEFWQDKDGNWEPTIQNVIEYIDSQK